MPSPWPCAACARARADFRRGARGLSRTPGANGEVERSHRIAADEFYRRTALRTAAQRVTKLQKWEHEYTLRRPHLPSMARPESNAWSSSGSPTRAPVNLPRLHGHPRSHESAVGWSSAEDQGAGLANPRSHRPQFLHLTSYVKSADTRRRSILAERETLSDWLLLWSGKLLAEHCSQAS